MRYFRPKNETSNGFTLIELIVAIVIISILTSIAVVVFTGQQRAAAVASLKNDIHNSVPNIPSLHKALTFQTEPEFLEDITESKGNKLGISVENNPGNPQACVWGYHEFSSTDKEYWYYDSATGKTQKGYCEYKNDIPGGKPTPTEENTAPGSATPTPTTPVPVTPPEAVSPNNATPTTSTDGVTFTPKITYNAYGGTSATVQVTITSANKDLTNYVYKAHLDSAPFWGVNTKNIQFNDGQAIMTIEGSYMVARNIDKWNGVSSTRSVTLTYTVTGFTPPNVPSLYSISVTPQSGNSNWYACVKVKATGLEDFPSTWSAIVDLKDYFKSIQGKTPTFQNLKFVDKGNYVYEVYGSDINSNFVMKGKNTNDSQAICYNPNGAAW